MTLKGLYIITFFYLISSVFSSSPDRKPLDCPANEIYKECSLEVCFKTCEHLKKPPPCPSIAAGCYLPSCECKHDYLRNSDGVCVPYEECCILLAGSRFVRPLGMNDPDTVESVVDKIREDTSISVCQINTSNANPDIKDSLIFSSRSGCYQNYIALKLPNCGFHNESPVPVLLIQYPLLIVSYISFILFNV